MNKQSEILEYINHKITTEGYSPSVREIAKAVNLKSTSSVQYHLDNLIKKGLLSKKANLSRSLSNNKKLNTFMSVPVIGEISAGTPLLAEENKIGEIPIVEEKYNKDLFALKVNGDSMIEDAIADGDHVIVREQRTARKGQIVVAITDEGEATLKRWYPETNRIRLEPANSSMKPIYVRNATIRGVVVGVVRRVD